MSRKDLRNGKESGRWKPHKWSDATVRRVRKHTLSVAHDVLCVEVGLYQATLAVAEIDTAINGAISRDAVHAAGLRTIGE